MSAEKTDMQKAAGSLRTMGVLTIIFGILAMAMPWVAGQSILLLTGLLVMAGGVTRMIWAFKAVSLGKGILVFLIGALTLVAGIVIVANPILGSGVLTIMLSAYFLFDGVAELVAAIGMPRGQVGKGWLMFDGVITLLLGVAIYTGFPLAGTFAIGVLLGIKLLFIGLTMLTVGSAAKRAF